MLAYSLVREKIFGHSEMAQGVSARFRAKGSHQPWDQEKGSGEGGRVELD